MKLSVKNLSGSSLAYSIAGVLVLLTLALYQQTVLYLNNIWSEISIGEYAHGYLVLAISVYLIFINWHKLKKITPCPAYTALPLLFLSVMAMLMAVLVDVEVVQAAALLLILLTLVWSILGHEMIKLLAFPILFLGFAIPIWFPLSPLLQNITADVVFWVARLINVPAHQEGSLIIVPGGVFSVEEACSGLRYLLAALTLGSLYAFMNYVSFAARVAVVAAAAAAAILTNFLRVFIVIYLGYATEMQHPLVDDHLMLGWYLFGGLMAIMLFLDARYYKHGGDVVTDSQSAVTPSAAACKAGGLRYFIVTILCLLILLTGPAVIYQQNARQVTVSNINLVLPDDAMGWSEPLATIDDWQPRYPGALYKKSVHRVRGDNVSLFMAYYPVQKQGMEVINELNRISDAKIWKPRYAHPEVRQSGNQYILEQVLVNQQNDKRLIWYWYNVGGQETINKYEAKVLQLKGILTARPQAYMIAVSIDIRNDIKLARQAMQRTVSDLQKPLAEMSVTQ